MLDASDYELQKDGPTPYHETRSPVPWVAGVAAVVLLGGAIWYYVANRPAQPLTSEAPAEAQAPSPSQPLGAAAAPIELPPLAEMDPIIRRLVGALSSQPVVGAWLATDDLLRSFTVAVENIANGATPARRLSVIRPAGPFRVIDTDDDLLIDPRSYDRYMPLASAVDSLDASGVARLYTTVKPRIEEAYGELGRQRSFDIALEEAIVAMLRTPALDGNVRLVPRGALYGYENPRFERLTAAQKQLARMGPRNAGTIQDKLREIALALGIPEERMRAELNYGLFVNRSPVCSSRSSFPTARRAIAPVRPLQWRGRSGAAATRGC